MMVSDIKLYEILKQKLGDKEAEALVEFIDSKLKEQEEQNARLLATKQDMDIKINDLLKWMVVLWISQLVGVAALLKMFH